MDQEFGTKVWEEEVIIPTYEIGEAEKNPIFSEKRVYQGSSGRVYPYPVIETLSDEKHDKAWKAVYLENQYIKVMILPQLGGRIQRAYDKTNDYDFVYYNHVIKPALVGLTGPWISGGIEFNWPQHHRPTTYQPVDYQVSEHEDGSKTVMVNDVDQMYGTKGIASFTLYPDKAYIEIRGQLYNRTPMPQTFLWWANPAVPVNENTQSVFPPDVHAVMDHGKRDVSKFPIATGVYYKHDYSEGVDISRYKNIPVPTSYMAEKSDFDFVGGYDYGVEAGILHVADHHISPGKKQWTWGCGDFGKAWDKNLTDEDGPYIELMTGVFTDNQPDFTWLKPFEEKTFKQYFMPYKKVGYVKNATVDAMVNMEIQEDQVSLCIYTTGEEKDARVILEVKGTPVYEETATISPEAVYEKKVPLRLDGEKAPAETRSCQMKIKETDVTVRVVNAASRELVSFTPLEEKIPELPKPAQAAKAPEDIMTCEELYLTGLHIEQYRHATYRPDDYYLEGLKRDGGDIRLNTAYGCLLLRRGLFTESEKYFRKALERMTWKNPNPYNSEAYYDLGLTLFYQERFAQAYDAFFKAAWSNEQQEMSFYFLAAIAAGKKEFAAALELVEKGLVKNSHNIKARGLKAVILRKLGREKEALDWIAENKKTDAFDYVSRFEEIRMAAPEEQSEKKKELKGLMRDFHQNFIQAALDYMEGGFFQEALEMLEICDETWPMIYYYRSVCLAKLGRTDEAKEMIKQGDQADPYCCFPNRLEDKKALELAAKLCPDLPKAFYYLGNLWYDKQQYDRAKSCWEQSAELDSSFPTVLRNLSLVYYNKFQMPAEAKTVLEKAFALDTGDARVFLELDQLYKKLEMPAEERLAFYEKYSDTFVKRDDVFIEYITLQNFLGNYEKAYELLMNRKFHPWEGGEGKATTQYTTALTELAKIALNNGDAQEAKELLEKALVYPENLGEGKLEGTKDNHIYYYLGIAQSALGNEAQAEEAFELASAGVGEPAGMMFYNDQPADMILYQGLALEKRQEKREAYSRFYKLTGYGEAHIYDQIKMDYFAVSYPDLLIFEEDFTKKNKAHCYYLMGLGKLGLGMDEEAEENLKKALELDPYHQKAQLYLRGLAQK
ncbi:MAG: DUF5107 domain-containing protein [Lachnospiraceae bacterium]|nr:DUF5107 domain-containing protein [Lachnospiraceae bacterium]